MSLKQLVVNHVHTMSIMPSMGKYPVAKLCCCCSKSLGYTEIIEGLRSKYQRNKYTQFITLQFHTDSLLNYTHTFHLYRPGLGPAAVQMVSHNRPPPTMALPVQVPPYVNENGTLTHVVLPPQQYQQLHHGQGHLHAAPFVSTTTRTNP